LKPLSLSLLIVVASVLASAQVPVQQDPHHRTMFESAAFRILDVNIPAGTTSADHRHEFDIATIAIAAAGTPTRVQETGQPFGPARPARPLGDATVAEYTGKAGSHRVQNTGKTPYQLFAVENLRKGSWTSGPAASGLATKMTNETRAFRIYDVRLTRETGQTAHTHTAPTIALLVNGSVLSDGPDAKAKENAPAPVGLKQLTQPGQWLLIPAGDTHHVVRLSTTDARVIEIEVR
jgi:hypothetical protein